MKTTNFGAILVNYQLGCFFKLKSLKLFNSFLSSLSTFGYISGLDESLQKMPSPYSYLLVHLGTYSYLSDTRSRHALLTALRPSTTYATKVIRKSAVDELC